VKLFDWHRVGVHEYTYSEGLKMDPMREDGRRCLTVSEMEEKGWEVIEGGYWQDPARVLDARQRLRRKRTGASERQEVT
jgi:hypothetical protein